MSQQIDTTMPTDDIQYYVQHFCGLAPFARANLAGKNLLPLGQALLERATQDDNNAILLMNLSLVMQSLGQHELGIAIQSEALLIERVYTYRALEQPARIRLLLLCVAGDIAENTPLDCLLEVTDIDIIFYYVATDGSLSAPIPEHDLLMVGICESDENAALLRGLTPVLSNWQKPIINAPERIINTGRKVASLLLQGVAGLIMPTTFRLTREVLTSVGRSESLLSDKIKTDFPIIIRPLGSHAGHDLERINDKTALCDYLARINASAFFVSRFVDYSGNDGLFRKLRVMLIDGKPYIAHLAISSHWMIHYVNAGMYEDAQKREAEKQMMENFDAFIAQHKTALDAIYQRTKLDYLGLDCAETQDGKLLIFEIDHVMVVHDMDPPDLFPYKHDIMLKAKNAFRDMLIKRCEKKEVIHG
jgi:glutathione synthase/RimK-type ligase-like ATP-grasp enzyme